MHKRIQPKKLMQHTLIRSRAFAKWTFFTPLRSSINLERLYHMTRIKTAKALNVTIPFSLVGRADDVIE